MLGVSITKSIHNQVLNKIKHPELLKNNEGLVRRWAFGNREVHAGQILGQKILPNGNKQIRITTAYAGEVPTIATDTRVYAPNGELLKAYHGIRGAKNKYANTSQGVKDLIDYEKQFSPSIKYLNDFPKTV